MTSDEAIKQLASLIINSQLFHRDEGDIWEKDIEALRIAIKAVEKQIPKEPITTADGCKAYSCGLVLQEGNKRRCLYYCDRCGQRIDLEGLKMTNYEKFGKDMIVELINECECGINVKNGELIDCNSKYKVDCNKCLFNRECGDEEKIRNWLNAEYQEVDWSKVPIDTKVLVSNDKIN